MTAEVALRGDASRRAWREIAFVCLIDLDRNEAERVVAQASAHVRVPCRLLEVSDRIEPTRIPGREQIDAEALLGELERLDLSPDRMVVGVTGRDLAIPVFTFVFGLARAGGRAAVVSIARLRPEYYGEPADPALTIRRGVGEVLHELGHLAGLVHCVDHQCLMHFSSSVEALDLRGLAYCAECRAGLVPAGIVAAV
jgi:predicted Zn-dependent protease